MTKIPEEKINFLEKNLILEKLNRITEKEWCEIVNRCKNAIKYRIKYTSYGAHSVSELGLPALDYYINEAISLIYQFRWGWNYERISIEEHIIKIANSLISRRVDSYKRKREDIKSISYNDEIDYDLFEEVCDNNIDLLIDCIERITASEQDLSLHWEAIKEGLKPREIASLMEIPVNKVYKQNDRLIYQAKTKCISN
jgi:hypothetical protein